MTRHILTPDELAKGRRIGAPLGGHAVGSKTPPKRCPRCGHSMKGRVWHSYLGHLGLHGLADKYFNGDTRAAQKRLRDNGLAQQDPIPCNHAMPKYQSIGETNG